MCRFLSAIVRRNGDIICHPEVTDSHSELADMYGLPDNGQFSGYINCARVEFAPDSDRDLDDLTKYKFSIDETVAPEWWTSDISAVVRQNLSNRIARFIKHGSKRVIIGDVAIVPTKRDEIATIENVKIPYIGGPTVIRDIGGDSRIGTLEGVRVTNIFNHARIVSLVGDSVVGMMYGYTFIEEMLMPARIKVVSGGSQIERMAGCIDEFQNGHILSHQGEIKLMTNSAHITQALGRVEHMCAFSSIMTCVGKVERMSGSSVIQLATANAKIGSIEPPAMVCNREANDV